MDFGDFYHGINKGAMMIYPSLSIQPSLPVCVPKAEPKVRRVIPGPAFAWCNDGGRPIGWGLWLVILSESYILY